MVTRVQKWGNSQGLRISKELLAGADLAVGDEVELVLRDGELLVRPVRRVRGRIDLAERVAQIPEGPPPRVRWCGPVGREVW